LALFLVLKINVLSKINVVCQQRQSGEACIFSHNPGVNRRFSIRRLAFGIRTAPVHLPGKVAINTVRTLLIMGIGPDKITSKIPRKGGN
jgi:hypothetical protein